MNDAQDNRDICMEETVDEPHPLRDADQTNHDVPIDNVAPANPQDNAEFPDFSQVASYEDADAVSTGVTDEGGHMQCEICARHDSETLTTRRPSLGNSSSCVSESKKTNGTVRRVSVQWAEDIGPQRRISSTESIPDCTAGGSSANSKKNNIWTR